MGELGPKGETVSSHINSTDAFRWREIRVMTGINAYSSNKRTVALFFRALKGREESQVSQVPKEGL